MRLESTLTTPPYGSGVAFRNTERLAEFLATLRQEAARDIQNNLRRDIRCELTAKLRMVKGEHLNWLLAGYVERWKQKVEMQFSNGPSWMEMRGLLRRAIVAVRLL